MARGGENKWLGLVQKEKPVLVHFQAQNIFFIQLVAIYPHVMVGLKRVGIYLLKEIAAVFLSSSVQLGQGRILLSNSREAALDSTVGL